MASDYAMTFHSSLQDEEDFDDDIDDVGFDHHLQHQNPHNLSRLSVCTSSTLCDINDVDDDVDSAMTMYVSRLSIESFEGDDDGDADGELSDGKDLPEDGLSSESENEVSSCYSLPATPPRRRNRVGLEGKTLVGAKDYASDNEAQKGMLMGREETKNDDERRRRNRRVKRGRWVFDRANDSEKSGKKKEEEHVIGGFSGESDQSGGGTGVVLITRPKGGKRSLCMGLEEVKACRDLGFELEHELMLEMPSRLSFSNSTLETTSSGGNSPIANWRISGPGMLCFLLRDS